MVAAPYCGVPISRHKFFFVDTNNNRICCIRVCNNTFKLLLINVYMPYKYDTAAADEFSLVLADVITGSPAGLSRVNGVRLSSAET